MLLASSAELGNLRKFKSLASKSCTSESLAYFFYYYGKLDAKRYSTYPGRSLYWIKGQ